MQQHLVRPAVPAYVFAIFVDIADFPSGLQPMLQQGFLDTSFQDYLTANNGYFEAADSTTFESREFEKNRGVTITDTRPGLKAPVVVPVSNSAAQTPPDDGVTPSDFAIEQFTYSPFELTDGIDLDLIGTNFSIVDRFEHNCNTSYHQAAQSVDLLARDTYIAGYATGNTFATVASSGGDTAVEVDDIRSFDTVITVGASSTNGVLVATSVAHPMPATVYPGGSVSGAFAISITSVIPHTANISTFVPSGSAYGVSGTPTAARGNGISGTLLWSGAHAISEGDVIVAGDGPAQIFAGGVTNWSKIVAASGGLTSVSLIDAVNLLENNAVPYAENSDGANEGTYVAHAAPSAIRSLYNDSDFKTANQTLGQSDIYLRGRISKYLGVTFLPNTNAPRIPLPGGGFAYLTIVTGQGALVDRWYAGLSDWVNNMFNPGLVAIDRGVAQILMPAYTDRQGRRMHIDWLTIRDMVCPTDVTRASVILTGTAGRRARAVAIWTYGAT